MNKVSIIVPVYNVENYLYDTIESILSQTYTDIEIILIDDNSKDNSLKICKEYEGIISSITSFGMFVELPNTVEGLIHFEDLGNEYFIYDEERKTLQGEKSKKIYKIGDSIKVCVIFADKLTRKVDFEKISS